MGKELIVKHKSQLGQKASTPGMLSEVPLIDKEEISLLWTPTETACSNDVKENGQVYVVIRQRGKDVKVICKGLANKGNNTAEIFKRLMQMGLITPETKVLNFLKYRNNMWFKEDVQSTLVNSGDALMIMIEKEERKVHMQSHRLCVPGIQKRIKKVAN